MSRDDLEHLKWIYERMIYAHNEKPNYDYMLKFKDILNKEDVQLSEKINNG